MNNIVTDIVGTLTSPDLPKLFLPDFRDKGPEFVQSAIQTDNSEVLKLVDKIASQYSLANREEVASFAYNHLANKGRDSGVLELMGMVNTKSLETGNLKVEFYPDVPIALRNWNGMNMPVSSYSTGSELVQRAIYGGLSNLITGQFFDTSKVGKKNVADSYKRICDMLQANPKAVRYYSDGIEELDAANAAGLDVILIDRINAVPQSKYLRQTTL